MDGPNINQILIHQEFGYGANLSVEPISLQDTQEGSAWVAAEDSYWMISTHRGNEAKEIAENLAFRGFVTTCRFEQDSTIIVRLD